MVLFQVTARTVLHALMLKKAACPCPFKALLPVTQSALIGQLTQAWTSSINDSRAAVLDQFLCEKPAARQKLCKCVTWWHSVMSHSDRIKG